MYCIVVRDDALPIDGSLSMVNSLLKECVCGLFLGIRAADSLQLCILRRRRRIFVSGVFLLLAVAFLFWEIVPVVTQKKIGRK